MSEYIVQAAEWAIDKNGNSLYQGCEEIVRCRDCRYWATEARWLGHCVGKQFDPDGYCKWGKKREAGE